MKSQTLIIQPDDKRKMGEGDLVMTIHGNRSETPGGLLVDMDWCFVPDTNPLEIKAFIGTFLSGISDIWGEKMVTEAIMHYAEDNGRVVKDGDKNVAVLKSAGLDFKKP